MDTKGIRLREDGRYEARYKKGRNPEGQLIYGSVYGATMEEAVTKRDKKLCEIYAETNPPRGLKLLILGAGCHGQEVYDIAQSLNVYDEISFLDDNAQLPEVIGKWEDAEKLRSEYVAAVVAVGDEEIRRWWLSKLTQYGYAIPTIVHPSAIVAVNAEIGTGSILGARTTICAGARIGNGCIISPGVTVERGTEIPDWTNIDSDGTVKIIHKEG